MSTPDERDHWAVNPWAHWGVPLGGNKSPLLGRFSSDRRTCVKFTVSICAESVNNLIYHSSCFIFSIVHLLSSSYMFPSSFDLLPVLFFLRPRCCLVFKVFGNSSSFHPDRKSDFSSQSWKDRLLPEFWLMAFPEAPILGLFLVI